MNRLGEMGLKKQTITLKLKMMKNTLLLLTVLGLLSLSSCKQDMNSETLLENPQTRTEVFNTISENHEYMSAFMEHMQNTPHAMQMMQNNKKIVGTMMKKEGMRMMMKDSTMIHSMMNNMMSDGKMMGNMMKMMHEKGMMSEDCMESCTKMMSNKGMDMKGMNKMDSSKKDAHKHH